MAIRLPLHTVLDYNDAGNDGTSSVAGGVAKTFTIPQDSDNVVVKLTASVSGGTGVTATLQTTDDGGTTWYDVLRTPLALLHNNTIAVWGSAPVSGMGIRTTISSSSSITTGATAVSILGATGSAAASTLGVGQVSGLPILSPTARVFLMYSGNVTANNLARVKVMSNSQGANT